MEYLCAYCGTNPVGIEGALCSDECYYDMEGELPE